MPRALGPLLMTILLESTCGRPASTPPESWIVFAALVTALVVAWQAVETRRSANAMQKSVRLQEVGFQQWVDIENWKSSSSTYLPEMKNLSLDITFDIVNPTDRPLTLRSIGVRVGGGEKYDLSARYLLTPRKTYPIKVPLNLKDERLGSYIRGELVLTIIGTIRYTDIFKILQEQSFGSMCLCGPERTQFSPFDGILPTQSQEKK